MYIDGGAATAMTQWNGDASELAWVRFDVTSLPYHLRKGGDVGIIGVGGGRDVLTALWANKQVRDRDRAEPNLCALARGSDAQVCRHRAAARGRTGER